jgi:hypothetical protein
MAHTWPVPPLFETRFIVLTTADLTGTRRGRLLCLELSQHTQRHNSATDSAILQA